MVKSLRQSFSRNRQSLPLLMAGLTNGLRSRRTEVRHHLIRDVWTVVKRFGAPRVINIERQDLACLTYYTVLEGPIDDSHRLLLASIARGLEAKRFFEFGTNRGYTTWTVVHNNPDMTADTLDVPRNLDANATTYELGSDDRHFLLNREPSGEAFADTPEAGRITQHFGDSATFDFAPFRGSIDLVYIDGAHTYDYVRSDTLNAFSMLSEGGTVAWDDYTTNPGVWRAVNEIAAELQYPVYHLFGTRMAICSRRPGFVRRRPVNDHTAIPSL